MDIRTHEIKNMTITPEILKLIAEIDEFQGALEGDGIACAGKAQQPEADRHD